jgi:glycosyltransferase involved in cell wall biosynthesis
MAGFSDSTPSVPQSVLHIVNCAELTSPGWRFLEGDVAVPGLDLEWSFYSCSEPRNWLERAVRRPRLSRYRACFQAAVQAKRLSPNIVVTHLPRATCWTAVFCRILRVRCPHLAFSFNFTDVPSGPILRVMRWAFSSVTKLVVYSEAEKSLYSQLFRLPDKRFDVVPWAMETPNFSPSFPLVDVPYICSIGGEGRDYFTLVEAMTAMPNVFLIIVCRRGMLNGLTLPPNVRVEYDLPIEQCWNLIQFSQFSVIPLQDVSTNCGHITIVASLLLGKALVTTRSNGTADYVLAGQNAEVAEAGDSAGLATAIGRLWNDPERAARFGAQGRVIAAERNSVTGWVHYLASFFSANA